MSGAWNVVSSLVLLAVGLVKAGITWCVCAIAGWDTPGWVGKTGADIAKVLRDPALIFEVMAQKNSDVADEKGLDYFAYMVTGEIIIFEAIEKFKGKNAGTQGTAEPFYQTGDDLGKLGTVIDDPKIPPNWEVTASQGHAIERIAEPGVTPEMASAWAENLALVVSQADGQKIMYLSADGVVVVAVDSGRVLTAYPAISFDATILEILRNIKD